MVGGPGRRLAVGGTDGLPRQGDEGFAQAVARHFQARLLGLTLVVHQRSKHKVKKLMHQRLVDILILVG